MFAANALHPEGRGEAVQLFVESIELWPETRLDGDRAGDVLRVYASAVAAIDASESPIAEIATDRAELRLELPSDLAVELASVYPAGRVEAPGLVFDLTDPAGAGQAFSALHRRASVERIGWQYRERSH